MDIEWKAYDIAGDGVISRWFRAEDGPEGSRIFASVDPDGDGFVATVGWTSSTELDEYSRGDGLIRFTLERVHKTSEEARATAVRCIEFLRDLAAVNPGIVFRAQQAVNGGHDAAGA